MMDFHCHLDLYNDPQEVIRQTIDAGMYVLSVTTTPKAFPGTKRMAEYAPRVRTALGLHPQLADERHSELSLFDLMLPETAYVGEIGLDGSKEYKASFDVQTKVFQHILDSCNKIGGRILSIHSRNAVGQVLEHLSKDVGKSTPILHWFSGSLKEVAKANQLGCWYSVGPAMLRTKSGRNRVVRMPIQKVLLETDGPFAKLKGVPLRPIHAELSIPMLSRLWDTPQSATRQQLTDNLKAIGLLAKTSQS